MGDKYNAVQYYQGEGWRVTSPYGNRTSPITGAVQLHTGIDSGGKTRGADVKTPYGGKVVGAGEYPVRGKTVTIRIAEGILQITQHHDAIKVKVGDIVRTGDVIATNGISGSVTGPHIHYELRQDIPSLSGRPIGRYLWGDPTRYFAAGDFERQSYVVQSGDTLALISKQYEISVEQLRTWNGRTPEEDRSLAIGARLWVEPPLDEAEGGVGELLAEIEKLKAELTEEQGKTAAALARGNELQAAGKALYGSSLWAKFVDP